MEYPRKDIIKGFLTNYGIETHRGLNFETEISLINIKLMLMQRLKSKGLDKSCGNIGIPGI